MNKRLRTGLVAVFLAAGAAVWLSQRHGGSGDPMVAPAPVATPAVSGRKEAALPDREALDRGAAQALPEAADRDMVGYLRDRYGKHIANRYMQMRMLEELIRHFQKTDPENWREALLAVLRAAFPELYDELAASLQRRLDYGDWMKANRARLQGLDAEARRAAIWDKRVELFGAEAAEEIWASEQKNRAVSEALATIDGHEGASVADRLSMYKQALEGVYEEDIDSFMEQHQHEVMNRFLSLQSVQEELSSMSAAERAQSLRDIRKGMGLDEAGLARWDDLDKNRDARWQAGLAYMKEREALVQRLAGAELEQALDALRVRYFAAEAETIKLEEQSGIFRFARPRRWGQN